MDRRYICIYTSVPMVLALFSIVNALEIPNVDLHKGTINGRLFYELTIDEVTSLFGRPEFMQKEPEHEPVVNILVYSKLGIIFFFQTTSGELNAVAISLVDNQELREFKIKEVGKYKGVMTYKINENSKIEDVLRKFTNDKMGKDRLEKDYATISFEKYMIGFKFEELNKSIEFISLVRN